MKKLLPVLIGLSLLRCDGGGGSAADTASSSAPSTAPSTTPTTDPSTSPIVTSKFISGKAAKGAYLPVGSTVEVRPAAVKGLPSAILTTTVSDLQGGFVLDTKGFSGPFLIRACNGDCTTTGKWYYSYAEDKPVHQTILTTVKDNSGSLNNSHFLISSKKGDSKDDFYVWFNVDGNGTDPVVPGKTGVKVDIDHDSSGKDVADAISNKLSPLSDDFPAISTKDSEVTISDKNGEDDVPTAGDDDKQKTGFSYKHRLSGVANINPYTDLMIRAWYDGTCVVGSFAGHINIDDVFTEGVYPSGTAKCVSTNPPSSSGFIADSTPIDLPDMTTINKVQSLMSKMTSHIFNIDLENVLTANWVEGQGFDAILDRAGSNICFYLLGSNTLSGAILWPDYLNDFVIYSEVIVTQTGTTINSKSINMHADIWTPQSTVALNDYYGLFSVPLALQSDSVTGNNHYMGNATITAQSPLVNFKVNNDAYSQLTIGVINYGVGTAMLWNFIGGIESATLNIAKPWTAGTGVSVSSTDATHITFAVPDASVFLATIKNGSGAVLTTKTYGGTWTGSDTIALSSVPATFSVYIVGTQGERTHVNYAP